MSTAAGKVPQLVSAEVSRASGPTRPSGDAQSTHTVQLKQGLHGFGFDAQDAALAAIPPADGGRPGAPNGGGASASTAHLDRIQHAFSPEQGSGALREPVQRATPGGGGAPPATSSGQEDQDAGMSMPDAQTTPIAPPKAAAVATSAHATPAAAPNNAQAAQTAQADAALGLVLMNQTLLMQAAPMVQAGIDSLNPDIVRSLGRNAITAANAMMTWAAQARAALHGASDAHAKGLEQKLGAAMLAREAALTRLAEVLSLQCFRGKAFRGHVAAVASGGVKGVDAAWHACLGVLYAAGPIAEHAKKVAAACGGTATNFVAGVIMPTEVALMRTQIDDHAGTARLFLLEVLKVNHVELGALSLGGEARSEAMRQANAEDVGVPPARVKVIEADGDKIIKELDSRVYASDAILTKYVEQYAGAERKALFDYLSQRGYYNKLFRRGDTAKLDDLRKGAGIYEQPQVGGDAEIIDRASGKSTETMREHSAVGEASLSGVGNAAAEIGGDMVAMAPGAVCEFAGGVFASMADLPIVGGLFAQAGENMNALAGELDSVTGAKERMGQLLTIRSRGAAITGKLWGAWLQTAAGGEIGALAKVGTAGRVAGATMNAAHFISDLKAALASTERVFAFVSPVWNGLTRIYMDNEGHAGGSFTPNEQRKRLAGHVDTMLEGVIKAARAEAVNASLPDYVRAHDAVSKQDAADTQGQLERAAMASPSVQQSLQRLLSTVDLDAQKLANDAGAGAAWKQDLVASQKAFRADYDKTLSELKARKSSEHQANGTTALDEMVAREALPRRRLVEGIADALVAIVSAVRKPIVDKIIVGSAINWGQVAAEAGAGALDAVFVKILDVIETDLIKPQLVKLKAGAVPIGEILAEGLAFARTMYLPKLKELALGWAKDGLVKLGLAIDDALGIEGEAGKDGKKAAAVDLGENRKTDAPIDDALAGAGTAVVKAAPTR